MFDPATRLEVLYDSNSSFTNYSNDLATYSTRNEATITLDDTVDYLYIGFYKQIKAIYPAFSTANTIDNVLSIEYYNGTTWTDIEAFDDSAGLTRNGLISWEEKSDWASTEVDSIDKFWIRIRPSVTNSATTFTGLNLLFSDDEDLLREFPDINDETLIGSASSHVLIHESSKNKIIQTFRVKVYSKINASTGIEKITPWDLHDIHEVRQASIFMTLSTIFLNASDEIDDSWYQKYLIYKGLYEQQLDFAQVMLDTDDDGITDPVEQNSFRSTSLTR